MLRPLILATVLAAACAAPPTADPSAALREADVGLAAAVAAAQARVPHGAVVDAEFEVGRRGPVYEVEVLYGGDVHEIYVDVEDGEVIRHEDEFGDEELDEARAALELLKSAQVGFEQAITTAERELDGAAYDADISAEGYVILVLTERGSYRAVVDSNNASILSIYPVVGGPEREPELDADDRPIDEKDRG